MRKLHEGTFKHFFSGLSAAFVEEHVAIFLSKKLNRLLYPPVFTKLQEAKKAGYYTAILSSSPDFLVSKIAYLLGVDTWDSTIYQKNGRNFFSQITQFMEGKQKAQFTSQLIDDLCIKKEDVTAYTDSYLDLPFLQAAGQPIAVNPDRRLKAACRKYQWPTI